MQAPAIAPENGQASPEVMRRVQQTVQDNISAELSPSDRLIVQEATERLMSRARAGFWVGSLVGGLIAFRGRWAAGQAARRTGIQPRLFFPSAKEGAGSVKAQQEAAKKAAQEGAGSDAAGDEMRRGRAVFFGKAMGYGILGSIAGTWVGLQFGKSSASKYIEATGRRAAIDEATERGMARAAEELGRMTGQQFKVQRSVMGGTAALPADLRSGGGMSQDREGSGVAYGEPGRELSHETLTDGVGYSDRAPPQDQLPTSLSDSSTAAATSASSSGSSRWDELRRSRAAPPSKWDALREANSRSSLPSSGSPSRGTVEDERDLPRDDGDEGRAAAAERERRRREFDALFEKEARGGDDSMGDKPYR
ncbi:uncharacterized protein JCM10292_004235 [Rhodotorula paludigena]|uniref:uncharacterized protein n=1 Tax=Rhodotorula paludigena TaxID=86838 RepID=UPI00317D5242